MEMLFVVIVGGGIVLYNKITEVVHEYRLHKLSRNTQT